MLSDSIKGLDKVIRGDVRSGYVILVSGESGTLKSIFTYTIMNSILKKAKNKHGVYVSLEQNREEYLLNMKSFNAEQHKNLNIIDIASLRESMKKSVGYDIDNREYLQLVIKAIQYSAGPVDNTSDMAANLPICFALDSLNALLAFSEIKPSDERKFINDFFYTLKKMNVMSIIIWESRKDYHPESFLADGVIELGIDRTNIHEPERYIIIKKLRGVEHKLGQFMLEVKKDGLEVVGKRI